MWWVNLIPSIPYAINSKSGGVVTSGLNLNLIDPFVNIFKPLTSFNSSKTGEVAFFCTSNWLFGSSSVMFLVKGSFVEVKRVESGGNS